MVHQPNRASEAPVPMRKRRVVTVTRTLAGTGAQMGIDHATNVHKHENHAHHESAENNHARFCNDLLTHVDWYPTTTSIDGNQCDVEEGIDALFDEFLMLSRAAAYACKRQLY